MKKELKEKNEKMRVLNLHLPGHSPLDEWMSKVLSWLKLAASIFMHGPDEKPKGRIKKHRRKRFTAKRLLRTMTVRDKIALGYRVYLHMENSPDFASASPSPLVLHAATSDLDEAHYDFIHEQSRKSRINLELKAEVFDTVFKAVLEYLDSVAGGRESVYRSAGIEPMRK